MSELYIKTHFLPPAYDDVVQSPRPLPSTPSRALPVPPQPRYLYYQVFGYSSAQKSSQAYDSDDPTVGRVLARNIAPPRTAAIVKRYIADLEALDETSITELYTTDGGEPVDDDTRLNILDEDGPGSCPESPIQLIARRQPTPLSLNTSSISTMSRSPHSPGTSSGSPGASTVGLSLLMYQHQIIASPITPTPTNSFPPEEIAMSVYEPGKAISSEPPRGWVSAHLVRQTDMHTVTEDGRFKSNGKVFPARTPIYVDKSSSLNRTVLAGSQWNTYLVMVPSTRDVGFIFPERLLFD